MWGSSLSILRINSPHCSRSSVLDWSEETRDGATWHWKIVDTWVAERGG
jgi:hypothetical protein